MIVAPAPVISGDVEQVRKTFLPPFFDLVLTTGRIHRVSRRADESLEIVININEEREEEYYNFSPEGLIFTRCMMYFDSEILDDINSCDTSLQSACHQGCGCKCLLDLGYVRRYYTTSLAGEVHCRP